MRTFLTTCRISRFQSVRAFAVMFMLLNSLVACDSNRLRERSNYIQEFQTYFIALERLNSLEHADLTKFYVDNKKFERFLASRKDLIPVNSSHLSFIKATWFEREWIKEAEGELLKLKSGFDGIEQKAPVLLEQFEVLSTLLRHEQYVAVDYASRKMQVNIEKASGSASLLLNNNEIERHSQQLYTSVTRVRYITEALLNKRAIPEIPPVEAASAELEEKLHSLSQSVAEYENQMTAIWYRVGYIQALQANRQKILSAAGQFGIGQ